MQKKIYLEQEYGYSARCDQIYFDYSIQDMVEKAVLAVSTGLL